VTGNDWDQIGNDEDFVTWMSNWLRLVRPKLKDNYQMFIFCDPGYMAKLEMMLISDGWPVKSRIIWEYRNLVQGRVVKDKFIVNYQFIFHIGRGPLNLPKKWDDRRFSVQNIATPQSNFAEGKHHPTAKPVKLIRTLVEFGSFEGDTILDPFAGSGTTGVACINVGRRNAILIERDQTFFDVANVRIFDARN
jgi:DNA modification methylase